MERATKEMELRTRERRREEAAERRSEERGKEKVGLQRGGFKGRKSFSLALYGPIREFRSEKSAVPDACCRKNKLGVRVDCQPIRKPVFQGKGDSYVYIGCSSALV